MHRRGVYKQPRAASSNSVGCSGKEGAEESRGELRVVGQGLSDESGDGDGAPSCVECPTSCEGKSCPRKLIAFKMAGVSLSLLNTLNGRPG